MKRLFRPRNLLILAVIGGAVFFAVKKKQENDQRLSSMSDDQVREMIHDRVGDKVDAGTESAIADKAVEKKEALAGSAASD